jgi:hypothetical protein
MRERDQAGMLQHARTAMPGWDGSADRLAVEAAIYCPACRDRRAIADWRARGEALAITLAPCGHVVEREARMEWRVPTFAEARAARLSRLASSRHGGRRRRRAGERPISFLA